MKQLFLAAFFAIQSVLPGQLPARAEAPAQLTPAAVQPLCLPGIYPNNPGDCTLAGPAAYLTQLASQRMVLPLPPLAASQPDTTLAEVDVRYGEVVTDNAPVYSSLEEAIAKNRKAAARHLTGDFMFVSYTHEEIVNDKRYYMIEPGAWMTAADISRLGVLPRFQGLAFSRPPKTAFGWILNYWGPSPLYSQRTPGSQSQDFTSHGLVLYDLVQVFAVQNIGGEDWYMIGPDEWVAQKFIALVVPNPTPPQGVTSGRWIEVNLYTQTLMVYDDRQLVFATVIASGAEPFYTQPGVFQIYKKLDTTPMSGAFSADRSDGYYLEDVPWTMYYDQARALHGAYWRAKMGFPQSHGCVNLTTGDAHWLYLWANEGDFVYVWDPSGRTPTDPSIYSSGGY